MHAHPAAAVASEHNVGPADWPALLEQRFELLPCVLPWQPLHNDLRRRATRSAACCVTPESCNTSVVSCPPPPATVNVPIDASTFESAPVCGRVLLLNWIGYTWPYSGMHNRTFGPYLAATQRTMLPIRVMRPASACGSTAATKCTQEAQLPHVPLKACPRPARSPQHSDASKELRP
jgi:hypothetical protein